MSPPGPGPGPARGARCRALYPFSGERHRHGLRFGAGELLTFLQAGPDGGWWEGESAQGLRGWFPAAYVQLVEVGPFDVTYALIKDP
ncbi:UNVERIFIED_CONTAM: Growth arrest-specific protein 7 [Gekko kuhli]